MTNKLEKTVCALALALFCGNTCATTSQKQPSQPVPVQMKVPKENDGGVEYQNCITNDDCPPGFKCYGRQCKPGYQASRNRLYRSPDYPDR